MNFRPSPKILTAHSQVSHRKERREPPDLSFHRLAGTVHLPAVTQGEVYEAQDFKLIQ